MTRRIAVLVPLLVALGALAPAPPVAATPAKTFTTNDVGTDPDAAPGDGTCATAAGRCSLQAAFDEAIALRKGTIVVGTRTEGRVTAAVRGSITLKGGPSRPQVNEVDLVVERGATLAVQDLQTNYWGFTVRGRLVVDRTTLLAPRRTRIDPSGTLVLRNAFFIGDQAGIVNHGRLQVVYSTLLAAQQNTIQNAGAGTSSLLASNIMGRKGTSRACGGTRPTSLGYNVAYDGTCGLNHPSDLGVYVPGPYEIGPEGTVRLDAIPAGEAGCGTTDAIDGKGAPRPRDGDGDGTAACDIGFIEGPPPVR